jgi:hypothetical protein
MNKLGITSHLHVTSCKDMPYVDMEAVQKAPDCRRHTISKSRKDGARHTSPYSLQVGHVCKTYPASTHWKRTMHGRTSTIVIALGLTFPVPEDAEPAPHETLYISNGRAQVRKIVQGGSLGQAGLELILLGIELFQDFGIPKQAAAAGLARVAVLCNPT